jgi:SpoVK/Ycf46/Vps4 family AAA+-type ATPase
MTTLQTVHKSNGQHTKMALSPTQQKLYDEILDLLPKGRIIEYVQYSNFGKTTLLKELAQELDAKYLRLGDFFKFIQAQTAFKIEEAIYATIYEALSENDIVIIDDFAQIEMALAESYSSIRRNGLQNLVIDGIDQIITEDGKKLILGIRKGCRIQKFYTNCLSVNAEYFSEEDYQFFFELFGGAHYKEIDYKRIHKHASRLNIGQIRKACVLIDAKEALNTGSLLKQLEKYAIVSNVNREEVDEVALDSLKGIDDVIKQLEIDVINPFENPEMAAEYGMSPKRGVLLYGPPGTGKTTIGKALAHRLKSKFFLIDGTIISGTGNFYHEINRVMAFARNNAPSIVFIDDCDLLLESGKDDGFYRYLLTLLDGLESKTNKNITIVMTTMYLSSIPDALIRSGRVELWLEMKLPNEIARTAILKTHLNESKLRPNAEELAKIVADTDGFTGADLKRLVCDTQNRYGYDVLNKEEIKPALNYFELSLERLKKLRKQFYRPQNKTGGAIGFQA